MSNYNHLVRTETSSTTSHHVHCIFYFNLIANSCSTTFPSKHEYFNPFSLFLFESSLHFRGNVENDKSTILMIAFLVEMLFICEQDDLSNSSLVFLSSQDENVQSKDSTFHSSNETSMNLVSD